MQTKPTVAMIGAGLAGSVCAKELAQNNFKVTVFEKSRGTGGRLANKRYDNTTIDIGAQYFTVRDPSFKQLVTHWQQLGLIQPWQFIPYLISPNSIQPSPDMIIRYVAMPTMTTLSRHLLSSITINFQTHITNIKFQQNCWHLYNENNQCLGQYDVLIMNMPPKQAAELLPDTSCLKEKVNNAIMAPCWTALLVFEKKLNVGFNGAFVTDSPICWLARNSSKPGRNENIETWVIQAHSHWTITHLESNKVTVTNELTHEFYQLINRNKTNIIHSDAHFWRYAKPKPSLNVNFLSDSNMNLGLCGDWCLDGRIEGAFLSGQRLSQHIISQY